MYRVAVVQPGAGKRVAQVLTLSQVGEAIRDGASRVTGGEPFHIASENTFVHNNVVTTLSLARTQGMVLGPAQECGVDRTILFVSPGTWRAAVYPRGWLRGMALEHGVRLVKGRPKGKDKKNLEKAAAFRFIPERCPEAEELLDGAAEVLGVDRERIPDVLEAIGVAMYARDKINGRWN